MIYQNILVEYEDAIAIVSINRPQALNALNTDTLLELDHLFDVLNAEKKIKAVVITGVGDKAFVSGADISEMLSKNPMEARDFSFLGHKVMWKVENLAQPVIAAVNGFALGGGCELALACDIRLASENARFGQPEIGLGITAGFGGIQRLARLVGKGKASELLFTAKTITAHEAMSIGLVNQVIPQAQLMETAKEMARTIAEKGSIAVQLTKSAMLKGLSMDLDKAFDMEIDIFALCFSTEEQKEGMKAFLSKRKPDFKGF